MAGGRFWKRTIAVAGMVALLTGNFFDAAAVSAAELPAVTAGMENGAENASAETAAEEAPPAAESENLTDKAAPEETVGTEQAETAEEETSEEEASGQGLSGGEMSGEEMPEEEIPEEETPKETPTEEIMLSVVLRTEDGQELSPEGELHLFEDADGDGEETVVLADAAPELSAEESGLSYHYVRAELSEDGAVCEIVRLERTSEEGVRLYRYLPVSAEDAAENYVRIEKDAVLVFVYAAEQEESGGDAEAEENPGEETTFTLRHVDEEGNALSEDEPVQIEDTLLLDEAEAASFAGYALTKITVGDEPAEAIVRKTAEAQTEEEENENPAQGFYWAAVQDGEERPLSGEVLISYVYHRVSAGHVTFTLVDESGEELNPEKYSGIELPDRTEIPLADAGNPPVADVRRIIRLSDAYSYESDRCRYVRAALGTKDGRVIRALRVTPAAGEKEGPIVSYTEDGESYTALEEDTTIFLHYDSPDWTRAKYSYSGNGMIVTATLSSPGAVPDNAEFRVTPITGGEAYDAYIRALDESTGFAHHAGNTVLQDIAFLVKDAETGEEVEFEPTEGSVSIRIRFTEGQLSERAADASMMHVRHLMLPEPVKEQYPTTMQASFDAGDVVTETVEASASGDVVEFSLDSLSGTAIDFSGFINDAKIQLNGADYDGREIGLYDRLTFELDYQVPGNSLTADNHTIEYKLPENFRLKNDISGVVFASDGRRIGSYTITNGADGRAKISITFDDSYAQKNISGLPINGYIRFTATGEEASGGEGGKTPIRFTEDIVREILVRKKSYQSEDLQVEKSQGAVDNAAGTVSYTIRVTSKNGTSKDILIEDDLSCSCPLTLEARTITKNGQTYVPKKSTESGTAFSYTLGPMQAGDEYRITYTAKLTEGGNIDATATNKVHVVSEDPGGHKIEDSESIKTEFRQNMVSKSGALQTDGSIEWTIKVNSGGANLAGWKLSDTLNGKAYTGTVHISPSIGGNSTITLPYTFANTEDRRTYTITYKTREQQAGVSSVTNKVTAEKSGELPKTSESTVSIGTAPGVMTKKAEGVALKSDGKTVILSWNIKVDPQGAVLRADWTFRDTLNDGQYFSAEQKTMVEDAWKAAVGAGNYTIVFSPADKPNSYAVTVKKDQTAVFAYHYESTAVLTNPDADKKFTNWAQIDGTNIHGWASNSYRPVRPLVKKLDAVAGTSADTTHNSTDPDIYRDGVTTLKWTAEVTIPDEAKGNIGSFTITDTLPAGVTLSKLELAEPYYRTFKDGTNENLEQWAWFNESGTSEKANAEISGQTVKMILSEGFVKKIPSGQVVRITYSVTLDKDDSWSVDTARAFVNTVSTSSEKGGDTYKKEAQQKQTVTKKKEGTTGRPLLSKSITSQLKDWSYYEGNVIDYAADINPNAEDVDPASPTITVEDALSFENNTYSNVHVSLVPGSVTVYEIAADGQKTPLEPGKDFRYVLTEESNAASGGSANCTERLTLTLPDEKTLRLEYSYRISGKVDTWTKVDNTIHMEGETDPSPGGSTSTSFKISNNAAGASVDGISVYKVDEENVGRMLNGAVFALYRYVNGEYRNMGQYVSGKNGNAGDLSLTNLAYNTAYRLVEVTPPAGYEISKNEIVFLIRNDDKIKYPESKPADFAGTVYSGGEIQYYGDRKIRPGSLVLEKKIGAGTPEESGAQTRTYEFTVQNTWNGKYHDQTGTPVGYDPAAAVIQVRAGQSVTIPNLPKGRYKIEERLDGAQIANYTLQVDYDSTNQEYSVESGTKTTAVITNSYTRRTGVLRLRKAFIGMPETLDTAKLYFLVSDGSTAEDRFYRSDGAGGFIKGNAASSKISFADFTSGVYEIKGLPAGARYQVFEYDAAYDKNTGQPLVGYTLEASCYDGAASIGGDQSVQTEPVAAEGTTELLITNRYEPELGYLRLTKRLGTGSPVSAQAKDYYVTVYNKALGKYYGADGTPSDSIQKIALRAGMPVELEKIPAGEYTVTELTDSAAIDSYSLEVEINGTAAAGADVNVAKTTTEAAPAEAVITNSYTQKKGSVVLKKATTATNADGTANPGLTAGRSYRFTLQHQGTGTYYDKDGAASSTPVTIEVPANGQVSVTSIPVGEYTVAEERSSAVIGNYTLTVEGEGGVTVTEDGVGTPAEKTITNRYTQDTGSLKLSKKIGAGTSPAILAEVSAKDYQFTVRNITTNTWYDAAGIPNNAGESLITVKAGSSVTIPNLPIGTYRIEEKTDAASAAGYTLEVNGSGEELEIVKDTEASHTITNTYTQKVGSLRLVKKLSAGSPVSAETRTYRFTVQSNTTGKYHGKDGAVSDSTLPVEIKPGQDVLLTGLPIGSYTVRELSGEAAISGYTLLVEGDAGSVAVAENTISAAVITNTYTQKVGRLRLSKAVSITPESPEALAAAGARSYRITVFCPTTGLYYDKDGKGQVYAVIDVKNGETLTIDHLPIGSYEVKELSADAEIDGYGHRVEGEGGVTVNENATASASIRNIYTQKTGKLVLRKSVEKREADGTLVTDPVLLAKEFLFTVRSTVNALYYDEAGNSSNSADTVVRVRADQADGVTIPNLPVGSYEIREKTADVQIGAYSLVVTGEGTVQVTEGGSPAAHIKNHYTQKTGKLRLEKLIAPGSPVDAETKTYLFTVQNNATHQYYDAAGHAYDGSSPVTIPVKPGIPVVLGGIPVGSYTVREVESGAEIPYYSRETTGSGETVTVSDTGTASAAITNRYTRDRGEIALRKKASITAGGTLPDSFRFTVQSKATGKYYDKDGAESDTAAEIEVKTNEKIPVVITGLPVGDYEVREVTAGTHIAGYSLRTVGEGEATVIKDSVALVTIQNIYTQDVGSLKLGKKAVIPTGDEDKLPAKYYLTVKNTATGHFYSYDAAQAALGNPSAKDEGTTETEIALVPNGAEIVLTGLPVGDYDIQETVDKAAVADYTLSVGGRGIASVSKDMTTPVTVINTYTKDKGALRLVKLLGAGSPAAASGKTYRFTVRNKITGHYYAYQEPANPGDDTAVDKGTAKTEIFVKPGGGNAVTLSGLPVGEYEILETEPDGAAIAGYTVDSAPFDTPVTIQVRKDLTASPGITNTYTRDTGSLTLKKAVTGLGGAVPADYDPHFMITTGNPVKPLYVSFGAVTDGKATAALTETRTEISYRASMDGAGGDRSLTLTGLPAGRSYQVTELDSAGRVIAGYTLAGVSADKTVVIAVKGDAETAVMTNDYEENHVDITKVKDEDGLGLAGAKLQLLREDGTVYAEWISTAASTVLTGVPSGTYTLHEVKAPDGYKVADDIKVEVNGAETLVTMRDKAQPTPSPTPPTPPTPPDTPPTPSTPPSTPPTPSTPPSTPPTPPTPPAPPTPPTPPDTEIGSAKKKNNSGTKGNRRTVAGARRGMIETGDRSNPLLPLSMMAGGGLLLLGWLLARRKKKK